MVESSNSSRKDSLDAQAQLGYSLDFKVKLPSGEDVCVGAQSQICFQQQNPKRPSSAAYESYERYKSATTILEFALLQDAARSKSQVGTDLKYDIKKGYAELLDWKEGFDAAERPKKEKCDVKIGKPKQDDAAHSRKVNEKSEVKIEEPETHSRKGKEKSTKGAEGKMEEPKKDDTTQSRKMKKDHPKKASIKHACEVKKDEVKKDEVEKHEVKEEDKRTDELENKKRRPLKAKSSALPSKLDYTQHSTKTLKGTGGDSKTKRIQEQLLKICSATGAKSFLYRQKKANETKPPALIARELAERKKMESLQEALTKRARTQPIAGTGEVTKVTFAAATALPVPTVTKDPVTAEEKLAPNALAAFGNSSDQQALFRELLGPEGAAIFMAYAAALGVVAPESDERANLSQEEQALRRWEVKLRGVIALSEAAADRTCEEVLSRARNGIPFAPNLPVMTFEEARAVLLRCGGKEALNRERARRVASSAPKG